MKGTCDDADGRVLNCLQGLDVSLLASEPNRDPIH
jgi:hypothetical protein